ncbi:ComF family protein [Teredinibacter sp. KSP-S5-2]|uniref:ComF family protein n=1 Tax=Teredinibacter sp. KSP-S5-2 TaxID=3034506 RepID=UPI00293507FB|nr:ComF family protein [Teredinibacter sp. KSP-S5-2]WNO08710.1 ComF family protein [Teredinibacter sp. KSP-S5-2]
MHSHQNFVQNLLDSVLKLGQFALPNLCLLCTTPSKRLLCPACLDSLPYMKNACLQCALPITSSDTELCGQCLASKPSFDASISLTSYQGPVPYLINQFKHQRKHNIGAFLSQLFVDRLLSSRTRPDVITFAPLYWRRQFSRGMNQAERLANTIGNRLDVKVEPLFKKVKSTAAQQNMTRKERLKNLKNSVILSNTVLIKDKHIVFVDDVMTTCATAETTAKLLRTAGAGRIEIWTIARTPKPK